MHNLKCCVMPEYSYGHCNTFSSNYGVPIDCREHVSGTVLEGQCHSGKNADCHGDFNRSGVTIHDTHYKLCVTKGRVL